MSKKRLISLVLAMAMIFSTFTGVVIVSAEQSNGAVPSEEGVSELAATATVYNFKSATQSDATNVTKSDLYSSDKGYGFVSESHALKSISTTPARKVDTDRLTQSEEGITIDETNSTIGSYNTSLDYNYGGMIFRVDTGKPGAYKLTVKTTNDSTVGSVAVTGMQASRLTGTGSWDNAGLVPKTCPASWNDKTWSYEYASGFDFMEIEVEPTKKNGGVVGIESITIEPLENNASVGKPTVHIIGDSTQKTYTFDEDSMSTWGQTLYSMFDLDQVNVVNYSMGGRAMKSNYEEGRFNDLLLNIREGDFVFIHSAHNDETHTAERFIRGADKTQYAQWLDMYCDAIETRGGTPVLVSGMPRTSNGVASVSSGKPNGFDPDSPTFMKNKAAADSKAEYVDLFHLAKAEFERIGAAETMAIYQSLEAGESPGKTNSGSYANGHPDNKVDGTHYKEAAGKLFSRLIVNNIYSQSSTGSDKVKEIAGYLKSDVKAACVSGDWSTVFPEYAKDVTNAKANGYPESNSYYRNQIEKVLQLGAMQKDENGLFNPATSIDTNDFISALCTIWNLDVNDFATYYNSGKLNRETMAGILYDAYLLKFGKNQETGQWNKSKFMTDYNGSGMSPDDPNYDPNLTGDSAQYYPLVGWGNITDKSSISREYLSKFYDIYTNLGLMRSEKGIARGSMKNGTELEPKAEVTRAKAAKELYFLFGLQQNIKTENQVTTIPTIYGGTDAIPVVYKPVTYTAKSYEFSNVDIDSYGKLSVSLKYNGTDAVSNKLNVEVYDASNTLKETKKYDVTGTGAVSGVDVKLVANEKIKMYVTASEADATKLSVDRTAECTEVILPAKEYTAETAAGIQNGTVELVNNSVDTATLSESNDVDLAATSKIWWKASGNVSPTDDLMGNGALHALTNLAYTASSITTDGEKFTGYITSGTENGSFPVIDGKKNALEFVAPADGVLTGYCSTLGDTKEFVIGDVEAGSEIAKTTGASGREQGLSAAVEKGKTYVLTVKGSKSRFTGVSFMVGAPVVSIKAKNGDEVQVNAKPSSGYETGSITVKDSSGATVPVTIVDNNTVTFAMPESDVTVDASFIEGTNPTEPPVTEDFKYTINSASFKDDNTLSVDYTYTGTEEAPSAKLFVATYDKEDNSIMKDTKSFDINGTDARDFEYSKPDSSSIVRLYIWNGADTMIPLSGAKVVGEAPTPTATSAPTSAPTSTPEVLFPNYPGWNIGQQNSTLTDGAATQVEYEGKQTVNVTTRNIYNSVDSAVGNGSADISTKIYVTPGTRNFRIYLENDTLPYYDDTKIFAEVVNNDGQGNNGNTINYGPGLKTSSQLVDLTALTAGWYTFDINLDYSKKTTDEFITVTVKDSTDTVVGTKTMGSIAGVDKTFKQVRLVQTGAPAYFADMTIKTEPLATDAPASAAPTGTPAPTIDPSARTYVVDPTIETNPQKYQFKTIREAVAAAQSVNPQSAQDEITINVMPGDYEEQVIISNVKFITLQQAPGTNGKVNLHWYYCTGYSYGNVDLNGYYDPTIDWSLDETWNGYNAGDEKFTKYEIGQSLSGVSTISYYDKNGVVHKNVRVGVNILGNGTNLDRMAPLCIQSTASDITVKDFNIVNSVPVFVTQAEKDAHITPEIARNSDNATSYVIPHRDNLAVCDEDTPLDGTARVKKALAISNMVDRMKALEALTDLTAGESAYLARSSAFNERGHAIAITGDRCTFENITARGNQDSVYISVGRMYFKNCDLIGGTDYIYGNASAVFDGCKLGAAGMTDKDYGSTITAANTDTNNPYGYLFFNCELYNVLDNITSSLYGRPWGADAQVTLYKTVIDDNATTGKSKASVGTLGWRDMSAKKEEARYYEYGTMNKSTGKEVNLSGRVVNTKSDMGTVLDSWQILEFNPRNYFKARNRWTDNWDPSNFAATYLTEVDNALSSTNIEIPSNEETTFDLPTAPEGLEFLWKSASANAKVSEDGKKITVIRPAAGEGNIESYVTLYAKNIATGFGDKKQISVTITPTTNTTDVFAVNGKVTLPENAAEDTSYSLLFSCNGAAIKTQTGVVAAGTNSSDYTVENIPYGTYDVTVSINSSIYQIADPANGSTTVTGSASDKSKTINVKAGKLVSKFANVTIDPTATKADSAIAVSSNNGAYTFTASGNSTNGFYWNVVDALPEADRVGITNAKYINMTYSYTPNAATSADVKNSYFTFKSGTSAPGAYSSSADTSRFTATRIYGGWEQLDLIDGEASAFSGTSNTENQQLNICGKFNYPCTAIVKTMLDFDKNQTSALGTGKAGSDTKAGGNKGQVVTFKGFPTNVDKSKLYFVIYPTTSGANFTISDVTVEYQVMETAE